jgi:Lhr-like helicase
MTYWKKGGSFKYYFENLSTIPDILKFKVFDSVGKKIIGSLDQRFVGDFGDDSVWEKFRSMTQGLDGTKHTDYLRVTR